MGEKLTVEEVARFNEAFRLADKNGAGKIKLEDLPTVLETLSQNLKELNTADIINEFDIHGKGEIDFSEFLAIIIRKKKDIQSATPSASTKPSCIVEKEKPVGSTVVNINDRKVKVRVDSESSSLYALCRQWLRSDIPRKDQPVLQNFAKHLPKPLPLSKTNGRDVSPNRNEIEETSEKYGGDDVEDLSEQELLENHVKHFRNVRKRLREQQKRKIERYKLRLALLLQPSPYHDKVNASIHS